MKTKENKTASYSVLLYVLLEPLEATGFPKERLEEIHAELCEHYYDNITPAHLKEALIPNLEKMIGMAKK
ncbi:unnamed protein product [Gemmata massiliana]|uniref:Uncharacterized protein n=1 Tax=Gemmata massiliana TaxID=1210884 RepID=A0A6P2CZ05_9BACT|nr:hypothetical protein [Gemmata massiliana]VTR94093.1 unnamed protein product [Gemmata massiliana]